MFFHHQNNPEELFSQLEESGYGSMKPAITQEDLEELCAGDQTLQLCHKQMNEYCTRYAHDVFNMMYEQSRLSELREKDEDTEEARAELKVLDTNRHNLHEAMMDSVNLMSRQLAKKEKDNEWMRELVAGGRAGYATFAMLTFYNIYSTIKKVNKEGETL